VTGIKHIWEICTCMIKKTKHYITQYEIIRYQRWSASIGWLFSRLLFLTRWHLSCAMALPLDVDELVIKLQKLGSPKVPWLQATSCNSWESSETSCEAILVDFLLMAQWTSWNIIRWNHK
jgi:hypothetical protein